MKAMAMAVLMALALTGAGVSAAEAGDVHVTLEHVKAKPGRILATLQTQAQFLQGRGTYSVALPAPSADGPMTFTFPDVAPGDYALAVLHDEDGDYQMKKAANGAPEEGWALSNGGALAGPPTFDVAKFAVGAADVTIDTEMFYPYVPPAQ